MTKRPLHSILAASGLAAVVTFGSMDRAEAALQMMIEVVNSANMVTETVVITDNGLGDSEPGLETMNVSLSAVLTDMNFDGTISLINSNAGSGIIPAQVIVSGILNHTADVVESLRVTARQTDFFAPDLSGGDVLLPVTAGVQITGSTAGVDSITGTTTLDGTNSGVFGVGTQISSVTVNNGNNFVDQNSEIVAFGSDIAVPYAIEFEVEYFFGGNTPTTVAVNGGAIVEAIAPEPAPIALLGAGLFAIGAIARRKRAKEKAAS